MNTTTTLPKKQLENERRQFAILFEAIKDVAEMQSPSVEKILKSHGYEYEAARVAKLVVAYNIVKAERK